MTKPEWGTKRKCLACGAFFYDMKKKVFTCPKCGAEYKADELEAAKLQAALKNASNVKALEQEMDEDEIVAAVVSDADFQEPEEENNEDLLEDASELGDDNHDMAEVMDNVGTGHDEE